MPDRMRLPCLRASRAPLQVGVPSLQCTLYVRVVWCVWVGMWFSVFACGCMCVCVCLCTHMCVFAGVNVLIWVPSGAHHAFLAVYARLSVNACACSYVSGCRLQAHIPTHTIANFVYAIFSYYITAACTHSYVSGCRLQAHIYPRLGVRANYSRFCLQRWCTCSCSSCACSLCACSLCRLLLMDARQGSPLVHLLV